MYNLTNLLRDIGIKNDNKSVFFDKDNFIQNVSEINLYNKLYIIPEKSNIFNCIDINDLKKYILDGFDINIRNNNNDTLLHNFVKKKKYEFIKLLCENGVDMNCTNNCGFTPLIECVRGRLFNSMNILKLLIIYGSDVNIKDNINNTVIHHVAKKGLVENLTFLVNMGVKFDEENDKNITPLEYAIRYQNLPVIHKLISLGVDLGRKDYLNIAICNDKAKSTFTLLNSNVKIGDNLIKLLYFSIYNDNLKIIKFLVKRDININVLDSLGNNLLHLAYKYDKCDIVKYLYTLNYNLDNVRNNLGLTPLDIAQRNIIYKFFKN